MSIARFTVYAVALLSSVFFARVLMADETKMAPRPSDSADIGLVQRVDPPVNETTLADGEDTEANGASKTVSQSGDSSGEVMSLGKDVYQARCAACHKDNGVGGEGGAPSLVGNSRLRDEKKIVEQILGGGQYMPGFAFSLADAEIAAVATYIRNSWDNHHGSVAEAEVTELR